MKYMNLSCSIEQNKQEMIQHCEFTKQAPWEEIHEEGNNEDYGIVDNLEKQRAKKTME